MIMLILLELASFLMGLQVSLRELRLLSGRYNYKIQQPQYLSICVALAYMLTLFAELYVWRNWLGTYLLFAAIACVLTLAAEYLLTLLNPRSAWVSWGVRFLVVVLWALFLHTCRGVVAAIAIPFFLQGLLLRNSIFGTAHGKLLCISHYALRQGRRGWDDMPVVPAEDEALLPDTQFAGNDRELPQLPVYEVTEYGIHPNSNADQLEQLQALVDRVGESGGGIIRFPKGRYLFNKGGDHFLQINYSNIILEGETDANSLPLAELVNCGKTSRGHKNPWVSPFFITTGEQLQPSNEFWGLQFRRPSNAFHESSSLSDPGSDGSLLTPEFATRIIQSSMRGDCILHVEDSSKVGTYALLGMYNTSEDGNLIRDILGIDHLASEWVMAGRAGAEQAPSYQWLVEVAEVIDVHTIRLVRPLLRDCDVKFEPELYNAPMLENICIRNLCINSCWNGQFRHHGFPLYYSVARSQEMDYGWNAINMKRVAHAEVSNVRITNFTNPLYVMDSRNVTVSGVIISGHDGHQGLKVYSHACDNLFQDITFRSHFADMMGGEGNAYANLFRRVRYQNAEFNPVDYDFHGFAAGPMSPPSDNMFTMIDGFRFIKSAGPLTHLPSCAQRNVWWSTVSEGERRGDFLFYAMTYRQKAGLLRLVTATGYAVVMMLKRRRVSPAFFLGTLRQKLANIAQTGVPRQEHRQFLPGSIVTGIRTTMCS